MKLIQSYVCEKYFVSTILRLSSAALGPEKYYETMVWAWDKEKRKRKKEILEQYDSGTHVGDAIEHHLTICQRLALEAPDD